MARGFRMGFNAMRDDMRILVFDNIFCIHEKLKMRNKLTESGFQH
jgi:hypothetical protein